jgi:hypothetical protein
MISAALAVALFLAGMLLAHCLAARCGTSLYRLSRGMPRRSVK